MVLTHCPNKHSLVDQSRSHQEFVFFSFIRSFDYTCWKRTKTWTEVTWQPLYPSFSNAYVQMGRERERDRNFWLRPCRWQWRRDVTWLDEPRSTFNFTELLKYLVYFGLNGHGINFTSFLLGQRHSMNIKQNFERVIKNFYDSRARPKNWCIFVFLHSEWF